MQRSRTSKDNSNEVGFEVGCGNVFVDLGFPADQAASLLAKADLMGEIRETLRRKKLKPEQAAEFLEISRSKVAQLMGNDTRNFTVDQLMKLIVRLGKQVKLVIEDNHHAA